MVALTVYFSSTASGQLGTADQLLTAAPAAETSLATTIAKSTGYIELRSITATTGLTAGTPTATTPAPSGNGWLLDPTTLEGQDILSGTWTPTIRVSASATTISSAFYVRAFKKNGGTYTNIGVFVSAAAAMTTAAANRTTWTGNTSVPAMSFSAVNDKLYIDVIANVTVNTAGSTSSTITMFRHGGVNEQVVTPGYQAGVSIVRRIGKVQFPL